MEIYLLSSHIFYSPAFTRTVFYRVIGLFSSLLFHSCLRKLRFRKINTSPLSHHFSQSHTAFNQHDASCPYEHAPPPWRRILTHGTAQTSPSPAPSHASMDIPSRNLERGMSIHTRIRRLHLRAQSRAAQCSQASLHPRDGLAGLHELSRTQYPSR